MFPLCYGIGLDSTGQYYWLGLFVGAGGPWDAHGAVAQGMTTMLWLAVAGWWAVLLIWWGIDALVIN